MQVEFVPQIRGGMLCRLTLRVVRFFRRRARDHPRESSATTQSPPLFRGTTIQQAATSPSHFFPVCVQHTVSDLSQLAPTLSRINCYPIKSLPGRAAENARMEPSGAIANDRRLAIVDREERFLNAKRTTRIHQLGYDIDFDSRRLRFFARGADSIQAPVTGHLDDDRSLFDEWLSDFFGEPASLVENVSTGFPDDLESPGPTVISAATLAVVAGWFALSVDETRARFRANLEVGGVPPFWEDRLYSAGPQPVRFRVGNIEFDGTNPCQRCVVPSRHPDSGDALTGFAKQFAALREEHLPEWAATERFDHFYRLAVNTRRVPGAGDQLRVGDIVEILAAC